MQKKLKKAKKEKSSLSPEEITNRIKRGNLVTPYSEKEARLIIETINNLDSDKAKQEYAQRYLELTNYLKKAEMDISATDEYKTSQAVRFCYEIAFYIAQNPKTKNMAQEKIIEFERKLEKAKKKGLIIPYSELNREAVILYIRNLKHPAAKESYYGKYYYMGEDFKRKTENCSRPLKENDRRNLRVALHCYEIAKSAYFRNILSDRLIEAKIQECKELLKK